jgi:hypothetical protein
VGVLLDMNKGMQALIIGTLSYQIQNRSYGVAFQGEFLKVQLKIISRKGLFFQPSL